MMRERILNNCYRRDIFYSAANCTTNSQFIDSQMEGMWKSILEAMTCIYCTEYLRAPVRQCMEGHLVCSTCLEKIHTCPQCKSRIILTRNRGIEQIAEILLYPCVNSPSGCCETVNKNNREKHEQDCRWRQVSCLKTGCSWTGSRPNLEEHLTNSHAGFLVKNCEQVIIVPLVNMDSEKALFAYDEYFRVCFNKRKDGFFGYVVCCGSNEKAEQFMFKMTLEDENEGLYKNMFYGCTNPQNSQIRLNKSSVFFLHSGILMKYRAKHEIGIRVDIFNKQCKQEQHTENNIVRTNVETDKESEILEYLEKLFRTAANGQVRALRKGKNSEGLLIGGQDMEDFLTELVDTTEDVFTEISHFGMRRPMWWYLSVFGVAEELWKAKAEERQLQADYLTLQLSQSSKETAMVLAGSMTLCAAVAQWAAVDMAVKALTNEIKNYGFLPNAVNDTVRNSPYREGIINLLSKSDELGGRPAVRKAIARLNQGTVETQRPTTSLLEILKDTATMIKYNVHIH